MTLDSTWSTNP